VSDPECEEELKFSLAGPEDHRKLVGPGGLAGFAARHSQVNIYLDSADLLLARAMTMLRIRSVAGRRPLLTLKSGTEVEAGYFRSRELETEIPADLLPEIRRRPEALLGLDLAPVRELRERFGEPPLVVIGVLINERSDFRAGGLVLEVDRMTFPDGSEEFEVEVETTDPRQARSWVEAEFRRLGVSATPSRRTKFERLLSRIPGRDF
jgi:uncharacterized protein YjbK